MTADKSRVLSESAIELAAGNHAMTATAESPTKPSWRDALAIYLQPRVLIVLFLGFSAGFPLALSGSTLQVWMREMGVDLGIIGLFGLVGTPYTLKFLWAPLIDALQVPGLCTRLGRRRGWLVLTQLLLMAAIVFLAFCDPVISPALVALGALLVAVASATQDIVIDAFRVESLNEQQQPAGQGAYVAAYRVGMLISTAGALYVVSGFEWAGFAKGGAWTAGYLVMAALVLIGIATTLVATEPASSNLAVNDHAATDDPMRRIITAARAAFSDFFARDMAIVILTFVVLFKLCDAFAGAMTAPFVLDLGFSRNDYATIVKFGGFAATVIGGFVGGIVARSYPLVTSLWIAAFLQMLSNLVFIWQAYAGQDYTVLAISITAESFTGAIGTVIFVVYLSALCQSPLHTATQFALLTALAAVGRIYISSVTGFVAEAFGWPAFFMISTVAALPSLVLLLWLQQRGHFNGLLPGKAMAADE
jgi:MFS transporter, PAT family, beta-lactamase induction signal transducer AmpG